MFRMPFLLQFRIFAVCCDSHKIFSQKFFVKKLQSESGLTCCESQTWICCFIPKPVAFPKPQILLPDYTSKRWTNLKLDNSPYLHGCKSTDIPVHQRRAVHTFHQQTNQYHQHVDKSAIVCPPETGEYRQKGHWMNLRGSCCIVPDKHCTPPAHGPFRAGY